MTLIEARKQLELLTQSGVDPQLTGGELDRLLEMSKVADAAGNAPSSSDWDPTYDLNRAAQMGWEAKAGKSADHHQISIGDRTQATQQVHDQCLKMAAMYRRRRMGTITTQNASSSSRQPDC
jgi:hypothetical protein